MKKLQPVWGRVLVKPDNIADTDPMFSSAKKAGIVIPEDEIQKEQIKQIEGTIIAVGGNAFEDWKGQIPIEGDRIIYDLYAGSNIVLSGQKHQIINDTDVIAVIGNEI